MAKRKLTSKKTRAPRQNTSAHSVTGLREKTTKRGVSLDLGQLERMAARRS